MGHEVFISHACKDKRIADSICEELESSGVKCWIAPRDIPVGEDWMKSVRKAIERSPLFVLVLSENANAAPHLEREIANAFFTGRKIVPFRVSNAIPSRGFLSYLSDSHCFDSLGQSAEPDVKGLAARIKELLDALGPTSRYNVSSLGLMRNGTTLNTSNLGNGDSRRVAFQLPRVVKRSVVLASILVAGGLVWWIAAQETDRKSDEDYLRTAHDGEVNPASPPTKKGVSQSAQSYAFSRFGLWVPAGTSPTPHAALPPTKALSPSPEAQTAAANSPPPSNLDLNGGGEQEDLSAQQVADAKSLSDDATQNASHREVHRRKLRARSERRRTQEVSFASVKGWVKAFFHEGVARLKEPFNR
jgi:hypothetical protein